MQLAKLIMQSPSDTEQHRFTLTSTRKTHIEDPFVVLRARYLRRAHCDISTVIVVQNLSPRAGSGVTSWVVAAIQVSLPQQGDPCAVQIQVLNENMKKDGLHESLTRKVHVALVEV